ncbi:flagellar assembly peptidoglycan hydrolase FlgJ [Vibrio cyclitrophicus]|uniref:flagellar assembly peptidoglycan hydrolase FlgJ n=1 Tax=Vibrio cyclitrophicus TaxID=47951 RepID=UPI0002DEC055|nr:flagellar assembly peptidoglycan hydrolase FlgJ [Vibrio cyclitrophicus]OEF36072.1 flagellar rod assembly protein/muramidase FlgJ [Vibrio cyclitrophicus 1F289]PME53430.1 flagellar rod assembly protein/muramidase FlgJ [Vibrio cyclitrophicus]PMF18757.1 flagellar rod assembly protein/muramidase FlgJ [Vibrio cyclitrophicus]PMF38471.1 flagellar rod assembly protein/muramidase FlgJ [Vibrio cyclitrophicus]PMJ79073.1 flagellar rod assembly protein/muramidase FlgJ [Vibrio cyclitrophicus]
MIKNNNDIGFIHDIGSLDRLRQQAVNGEEGSEKEALTAAAKQFESIFTSMLFKSMRDANSSFKSDMLNSQNEQFYRQMQDDQMASELSASGSLGLADMIVAQLSAGQASDATEDKVRSEGFDTSLQRPQYSGRSEDRVSEVQPASAVKQPVSFDSPESFVTSMKPYAEKAASALGVDSSLLLAQAALETGWGSKMVKNSLGNSNNLFNIKADRSWKGDKVATQTLEFHGKTAVKELASFRSYSNFEDSFNDYVKFLNDNPRYETALQHQGNSENFIKGIHQAGYATDPNYADKVLRVKAKIDEMN